MLTVEGEDGEQLLGKRVKGSHENDDLYLWLNDANKTYYAKIEDYSAWVEPGEESSVTKDIFFSPIKKDEPGLHRFYKNYRDVKKADLPKNDEMFEKCIKRIDIDNWIMPETGGFHQFIRELFIVKLEEYIKEIQLKKQHPDNYEQISKYYEENIQRQQAFVQNYLQEKSPYRGLLVYHGLGSGKTATSILAAESTNHRKIICFLPASLHSNYSDDLSRWGDISYRSRCKWRFLQKTTSFDNTKFNSLLRNLGIPEGFFSLITNFSSSTLDDDYFNIRYGHSEDLFESDYENTNGKKGIWYVDNENGIDYDELSLFDRIRINFMISKLIDNKYAILHYNGGSSYVKKLFENSLGERYNQICEDNNIKKPTDLKRKDCIKLISLVYEGSIENPLNNSFIVIDEVHNLVSMILGGGIYGPLLYYLICNSVNSKVLAMSGTPIINSPFEISVLINMIKGYNNIYKFKLTPLGIQKIKEIELQISNNRQISGFNSDGVYIYITRSPLGFIKNGTGFIHFSKMDIDLEDTWETNTCSDEEFCSKLKDDIFNTQEAGSYLGAHEIEQIPCFPDRLMNLYTSVDKQTGKKTLMLDNKHLLEISLENSQNNFIERYIQEEGINTLSIEDLKNRIVGYCSFYNEHPEGFAEKIFDPANPDYVDMSDYQLIEYSNSREKEREREDIKKRGKKNIPEHLASLPDIEDNSSDFFKVFSRQALLFTWPPNVQRPRKSDWYNKQTSLSVNQITSFDEDYAFLSNDYILTPEIEFDGEKWTSITNIYQNLKTKNLDEGTLRSEFVKALEAKFQVKELKQKLINIGNDELSDAGQEPSYTYLLLNEIKDKLIKQQIELLDERGREYSDLVKLAGVKDNSQVEIASIKNFIVGETGKSESDVENLLQKYVDDEDYGFDDIIEDIDIDKLYDQELRKQLKKLSLYNLSPSEYSNFYKTKCPKCEWREALESSSKISSEIDEKYPLNMLSPKMTQALKNMDESPGPIFFYSQFRTAEGVGIFSKCLEANGYTFRNFEGEFSNKLEIGKAVRYKVSETQWKTGRIVDITPEGDYQVYPGSVGEEEKEIITVKENDLRLAYYAFWSGDVKQNVRKIIQRTFNQSNEDPDLDNRWGQNIMGILATSAGAEGINLHYVRQVHILEPYWNNVRIDQVIGRSRRFNSHAKLPEDQRNVKVYYYISKFSDDQISGSYVDSLKAYMKEDLNEKVSKLTSETKTSDNEQIVNQFLSSISNTIMSDNNETSDNYLHNVSLRKTSITDQILNIMKETSIDCNFNLDVNTSTKGFNTDLKCYSNSNTSIGENTYANDTNMNIQDFKGSQAKIFYNELPVKGGLTLKVYISINVNDDDKDIDDINILKEKYPDSLNLYDFFSINQITNQKQSDNLDFKDRKEAFTYLLDNLKPQHKAGKLITNEDGDMRPEFTHEYLTKSKNKGYLKYMQLDNIPSFNHGIINKELNDAINSEYDNSLDYVNNWRSLLRAKYIDAIARSQKEYNDTLTGKHESDVNTSKQTEQPPIPASKPKVTTADKKALFKKKEKIIIH